MQKISIFAIFEQNRLESIISITISGLAYQKVLKHSGLTIFACENLDGREN